MTLEISDEKIGLDFRGPELCYPLAGSRPNLQSVMVKMDYGQRWLLMLAIATAILAIAILVLRINIRTVIIFYGIGVAATTLWMIVDARYFAAPRKNIQPIQVCACSICKHDHAAKCLKDGCACCLIKKNEHVVGHSSSSFQ